MTICFRPDQTNPQRLAKIIAAMGYRVERLRQVATSLPAHPATGHQAPLPKNAPEFFRAAFERARERQRPIVIDFWATWCGPCIRLKKETLNNTEVKKHLKEVELIYVDVDKHPSLAKAYGVVSVPDVFLVDADGRVVDRLRNFEPPDQFRARLERLIGHERSPPPGKKNRISP